VKAADAMERERSYGLFFEANPLPMWIFDTATLAFVAVNDAAIEHYGYSKSEFLGMTLTDIRPPHEIEAFLSGITTDARGQLVQKGIRTHRKKSGEDILVYITTAALQFQNRDCKLALINDITSRERARADLVEWMNRYEAAIKASGQILYDWDLGTGKVTYHGNAEAKLGFSAKELEDGLSAMVHPEDRKTFRQALEEAVETKSRFFLEYRVVTKAGKILWIEDAGHWVKNDAGKVVRLIGFLNDVSDRKNLETQLRQAQKMDALGRLAGGVAHDFNNLLSVILGYSQLLLDAGLPDVPAKRISGILQAGQRAANLTRQLLVFSRQEVVDPKILDVNKIVENMKNMLTYMVGEDVRVQLFAKANWRIKADSGQLEQVIMNLVVNARDAMPQGGTITVETNDIDLDSNYSDLHPEVSVGPYVQIVVSDTGMGMNADTKARIFEPFFTTKSRGTGLGLSTVYGIVKQCCGSISVYSEPGQGAAFKVYLPAASESVTAEQSGVPVDPGGGSETILVAEDEAAYRELIQEVLVAKGYNVLLSEDGMQALAMVRGLTRKIDVLLTDSVMPSARGAVLAAEMKKLFPGIKIILMSGYTDRALTTDAASVSANLFLQKPFTTATLLKSIREVIDNGSQNGS